MEMVLVQKIEDLKNKMFDVTLWWFDKTWVGLMQYSTDIS